MKASRIPSSFLSALSQFGTRLSRILRRIVAPGSVRDIALTGTSNCVVTNGLSAGLARHPRTRRFRNKSFGASGTVAIASHLTDFDLGGYDYVFIEYCLNESTLIASGRERLENTYRQIAAMVDHAAGCGCVPVLVNLPTINTIGRKMPMLKMLEDEFVARGVALFDMQHLLEERARIRGVDIDACFMDAMHLDRRIAFDLGRLLIGTMERARAAGAIRDEPTITDAEFGSVGFIAADENLRSEAEMIDKSNRFLKASLLRLVTGQSVTLPAPRHGRYALRGVTYNARRSIGRLVTGDGDVVIDVKPNRLFGTERDLLMVALPSPLPETPIDGELRLVYEPPDAADAPRPSGPVQYPPAFELAGLTVHHFDDFRPLRVIEMNETHRRLHETLTAKDLARLDSVWDICLEEAGRRGEPKADLSTPDEV
jgi:hypothetical protein